MQLSVLFWMIWVIAILFSGYGVYRDPANRWYAGGSLILMVLIGLLAWKVFGPLLQ